MKSNQVNLLLTLLIFTIISGCSATGPIFDEAPKPNSSNPVVYVYRPEASFGAIVYYKVFIDGKEIARIGQNGFTWFDIKPGYYKVGASWGGSVPTVEIPGYFMEGDEVYFKLTSERVPRGTLVTMKAIPKNQAVQELKSFRYEKPD